MLCERHYQKRKNRSHRKGDHILKSTSDKIGKEFLKINKKEIND